MVCQHKSPRFLHKSKWKGCKKVPPGLTQWEAWGFATAHHQVFSCFSCEVVRLELTHQSCDEHSKGSQKYIQLSKKLHLVSKKKWRNY